MVDVTLFVAFFAGLVSFLAPCVLPLIPSFVTYLAGTTLQETETNRTRIFLNGFFFVLGFTSVFAVLGVLLNTILEAIAYDALLWLSRIGGAIIIFFGLYLTGLFRIPFLEREHKIRLAASSGSKYVSSFLFGAAFAAGWTPCAGAALGGILGLAASKPGTALLLLLAYAWGFGLPFLLIALFTAQAKEFISKIIRWVRPIQVVFGIILVLFGIAVFTQTINRIAQLDYIFSELFLR